MTTTYAYTNGSSLVAIDYSDSTPDVAFTYDRLGRQVSAIVAGVATNLYSYTLLGQLTNETVSLCASAPLRETLSRTYDALGRSIGFELDSGYNVAYGYDSYGRFASVGSDLMPTANYSYLADSDLLAGYTLGDFTRTVSYEPARSLISSVANSFGSATISQYDYTNDQLGRRTSRADSGLAFAAQPTYGDPATVEMPAYSAYSYNTRSEVTGATRRWGTPDAPGALVLGQQYAYNFDPIGNRITAAEGDTTRAASYTANALNQYSHRTVPDEKDLIGTAPTNVAVTVNQNPASRQSAYWHHALEVDNATEAAYPQVAITAVYNPPGTNDPDVVTSQTGHVFVAQTPESFQYDSDGNLTQDGRFTYTWDGENRLIAATTRDDLPTSVPREMVEYAYDHQSRRIVSSTAAWTNGSWQAVESRAFLYDGWNVVKETINHQPSTTNYYAWGLDLSGSLQGAGGIGGLLAASLDGVTAFYGFDANGNVGQLVATNGDLLAHYEYSPFGETIISTGPLSEANPFRFSTKYHEDESEVVYYGYRFYSPMLGRFLSRDPIEELSFWRTSPRTIKRLVRRGVTGPHEFAYVQNRSVNAHDPLGLADTVAYGGEPCSKALELGTLGYLGEGIVEGDCLGINICYKGAPTPCAFCNNAHPSLAKCVVAHEQHHKSKGDADCTGCDDYKPSHWNNEKLKKGGVKYMKEVEYGAFQAMLDCLKKEKDQVCGAIQDPVKKADCEAMFDGWIGDTEKDRDKNKPDGTL